MLCLSSASGTTFLLGEVGDSCWRAILLGVPLFDDGRSFMALSKSIHSSSVLEVQEAELAA
jgi:hypothetical protein